MLYYDATSKTGIVQEVNDICGTDDTNYTLDAKNRRSNAALDEFVSIALKEGDWSVEDTGKTTLPIATATLTSGKQDYTFPNELLSIETIEMLLPDTTTWVELSNIDKIPLNQVANTPTTYKKVGNSILLNPVPNYTVSAGLRIHYRRAFTYSTVSSTTFTPTTPGIPSIFHMWLARKIALPFLIDKVKANKNDIAALITQGNADIVSYFGQRERDKKRQLKPRSESCR